MTIQVIAEAMDVTEDSSSRQRDSCYSSSSTEDWYVVLDGQPDWSLDEKPDKTLHMAQINELESQAESEIETLCSQHLEDMSEKAKVSVESSSMDMCTSKVVTKHLARLSAIAKLATVAQMNDYYSSSIPSVAAEQRSMLSISMDSIECGSRDISIQHSLKPAMIGTQPWKRISIGQDSDQLSSPNTGTEQNSSPSAMGLSKLPTLLRSLLKKCSSTTTGSYQLADDKHFTMSGAEPVLLHLSYLDGRRELTDDNAKQSLLKKSNLVHIKPPGLLQNRPEKTSYRKRVFQPLEAIWKGFGK